MLAVGEALPLRGSQRWCVNFPDYWVGSWARSVLVRGRGTSRGSTRQKGYISNIALAGVVFFFPLQMPKSVTIELHSKTPSDFNENRILPQQEIRECDIDQLLICLETVLMPVVLPDWFWLPLLYVRLKKIIKQLMHVRYTVPCLLLFLHVLR